MLASFVLPAVAVFSFVFPAVAQQDACSAPAFVPLSCLTGDNGAASWCSRAPRQTTTLTVTTTTLDINTQTLTAHASSQTTVSVTSVQMSTKTITAGPVETSTIVQTRLSTESVIVTTYVPNANVVEAAIDPTCVPSQAISAFRSLPSDALASACSCFGHRIPIVTETTIITAAPVRTRTTDFAGTAPTTTIYNIVLHTTTVTEHPTRFITATSVTCVTSTITQSYAAPTFTQVYGPDSGCEDTSAGPVQALSSDFRRMEQATQQCQGLCANDPNCSFVYVQQLTTKRGGTPHFQCFFNDHNLDQANDLTCGNNPNVFGVAVGYDALDRGTEAL